MVRCKSEHEYLWCLKLHCEDFLGIISQIYALEERNITLGNKEMEQQHTAYFTQTLNNHLWKQILINSSAQTLLWITNNPFMRDIMLWYINKNGET